VPELDASYVLPLRRDHDPAGAELAAYLDGLAGLVEVLVVDGSPEPVWRAHHGAFGDRVAHLRPDPRLGYRNGKVNGVLTGLAAAAHEAVVLADDDVRYRPADLARLVGLLDGADLVRPQNYFDPLPWHARLDTARTLLNRVGGGDFPARWGCAARWSWTPAATTATCCSRTWSCCARSGRPAGLCAPRSTCTSGACPRTSATSSASGSARPTTSSPARPAWPPPWPSARRRPSWSPGDAGARWPRRPPWPWPPPRPAAAGPAGGPTSPPRAACSPRCGC
jgi:hypothetical protein